jgi:hypothetical protein
MRAQAYPGDYPDVIHPSDVRPLMVEPARGDLEPPLEERFRERKCPGAAR